MRRTGEGLKRNMLCIAVGSGLVLMAIFLMLAGHHKEVVPAGGKVITIGVFSDSYWNVQNGYSYQILEDAIALFEERNPGVKVEYVSGILKEDYPEWLAEQFMKGTAPDVFMVPGENFNDLVEIGVLKDMTELIQEDAGFDRENFYSAALDYGVYGEKQYALPYECAPKLMFVNKTILDREGLRIPDENWTWEDFYQICQTVTRDTDGNGTVDQFGVVDYTWQDAFASNGVKLFDENGTHCYFTDEKIGSAISFIEQLEKLHEGVMVTDRDFDLGNVAFRPMLFSEYRAYKPYPLSIKKYSGFEWECISMPAGEDGSNISELDTLLVAMSRNTVQEAYAWELVKLLTADEQIQSEIFDYSEGVSVLRQVTESDKTLSLLIESAGENSPFNSGVLSSAVENAMVTPRFRNFDEAISEVDSGVRDIMEGNTNISMGQILWDRRINNFLKADNR